MNRVDRLHALIIFLQSRRVLDEEPATDGIVLTLAAVEWESLTRWLLSFERDATVLTPHSLRKLLVTAGRTTAEHHERKPGGQKVS